MSADGRVIATGGRDSTAKVWDAATGKLLYTFRGHPDDVEFVQFSPDARLLATSGSETRVVDAGSGGEVALLPGHAGSFTSDGRRLVTAIGGSVAVWDLDTGRQLRTITIGSPVYRLALDPGSTRVAVGTAGGTASVWDLGTGARIATQAGHSSPVYAVAFGPDGERVATGSENGEIRVWDSDSGVTTVSLSLPRCNIYTVAFSPDGSQLGVNCLSGIIRVLALDIDDLIQIAERELTRSFTDEECLQYLHVDPCPGVADAQST